MICIYITSSIHSAYHGCAWCSLTFPIHAHSKCYTRTQDRASTWIFSWYECDVDHHPFHLWHVLGNLMRGWLNSWEAYQFAQIWNRFADCQLQHLHHLFMDCLCTCYDWGLQRCYLDTHNMPYFRYPSFILVVHTLRMLHLNLERMKKKWCQEMEEWPSLSCRMQPNDTMTIAKNPRVQLLNIVCHPIISIPNQILLKAAYMIQCPSTITVHDKKKAFPVNV